MRTRVRDFNDNHKIILGMCVIIGIIILNMLQDLVHSQVRNYHFYVSESLLYNSFWLIFVPLIYLQIKAAEWMMISSKYLRNALNLMFVGFIVLMHLITFPLVVVGFSELFLENSFNFQNVLNYELSEHLYLCIAIYLSVGIYLVFKSSKKIELVENDLTIIKTLTVLKGTQRIQVETDSIYYFTTEAPYVAIHTKDRKHLYSSTLKSLISKLDKGKFVRIHKSTIIHVGRIKSYTSRKNGDYDILLQNGTVVRMSRTYTADFKQRIQ